MGAGTICTILSRGAYVCLISDIWEPMPRTLCGQETEMQRGNSYSPEHVILRPITGNTYFWLGCKTTQSLESSLRCAWNLKKKKRWGDASNTQEIMTSLLNSINKKAPKLSFGIHIEFGIGPLSWFPCFPQFLISPFNHWKPNTRGCPFKFSLARNWGFPDLTS